MRKPFSLVPTALLLFSAAALMIAAPTRVAAKNIQQTQSRVAPLTNQDVIELLQARLTPDELIAKIKSSASNFDTSDSGQRILKEAGLPDAVIAVMIQSEKAPPLSAAAALAPLESQEPEKLEKIVVPAGTQLDVEAAYTVDSLHIHTGDLISFRVLVPIKINGITVIDRGALVTGRVVAAKRGGHWGIAGRLEWSMQDVVAVDGTRIPMRAADEAGSDKLSKETGSKKRNDGARSSNSVRGTSHSGQVITAAVVSGVLFPPLALMGGFKRGENAVLPEGKRFLAFVGSDASVSVTSRR